MKFIKQLKNLVLPFEDPQHPMYSATPEESDAEWDLIEDAPYQLKITHNDKTTRI